MSQYRIYITSEALAEIKDLPGNIRQRVRQSIVDLATRPNPSHCKRLQFPNPDHQLYRLRLENWRVIYAITEDDMTIDVLAIRKRPPHDYGDLVQLLDVF